MSFRGNFNRMLERSRGGIGQWVVLRHFDKTKRSQYWNDEAKEAVGGPPYEYTDSVILASKQTAFQVSRPSAEVGVNIMVPTGAILESYRYFVRSDVTIEEDDEILDLAYSGQAAPSVDYTGKSTGARITGRFKVRFVHGYVQGGRGEIGYKVAIAERTYTE